ncbi:MAG: protein-methionine-sulfoxide reductase catalytic subunit MsrP [Rhodospirillales bacterium]|nr:protein-methionine-sulfoxide reductase catalytic subunit MsrP [Rhodospirillales bacterium]
MLIKIKKASDVRESEVTDHGVYLNRRKFLKTAAFAGAGLAVAPSLVLPPHAQAATKLPGVMKSKYTVDEKLTPLKDVTSYNNFYEFGTGKGDPVKNAHKLKPRPWTVQIDGEVAKPKTVGIDDLINAHLLEERIYRFRCVEAWSMVIPWVGFPLAALLKMVEPTSKGKYVAFETLVDPEQMPGQVYNALDWPYREGLRIDEAMNPLTLMSIGLYGEQLPNQNGAPIRLVVPWKYGYKSIKSIVRITLVEKMPPTTWNLQSAKEYGFYSNVNPDRDHPRWSQRKERRIGEFLKRKTLPFNGYTEEVASLYAGMDLQKFH